MPPLSCLWPLLTWSNLPAWLPWKHLIWVNSVLAVPTDLQQCVPLSSPWASFVGQSLILYCVHILYMFHSVTIIHLLCSAVIESCTVRFLLLNYFISNCSSIIVWLLLIILILEMYSRYFNLITTTRIKKTLPAIIKYSIVNKHHTSTILKYFHLSIGFSKAYCCHGQ